MNFRISEDLEHELQKICQKDKKLFELIRKQLRLFQSDSKHPSLRNHKLKGSQREVWSISINRSIRAVYQITEAGEAYFFDMGTHDEVYKK